ncbi:MAG: hypothetical protein GTO14_20260 [Anaerolineales bacterium]|nr:hypothetical protein [Anaerolineales bacterium]
MSTYAHRTKKDTPHGGVRALFQSFRGQLRIDTRKSFGLVIVGALLAFEIFNYSTTEFAMHDLLGDLRFAGLRWSTILALAFCGMDFAGIARLFTPNEGDQDTTAVWYLLGAWFLAATMNAMLTWWAISLALIGHQGLGNEIIGRETLLNSVPIFVAIFVWLIRVLIIGTFTIKGEQLFLRKNVFAPLLVRQPRSVSPDASFSKPDGESISRRRSRPFPKPRSASVLPPDGAYANHPLAARPPRRR